MKKNLIGLKSAPTWTTHIGCIKGCSDYLGMDASLPWIYGGTGHAFVINMHEIVCPSGPTAWNDSMVHQLARNIGLDIKGVVAVERKDPRFKEVQEKAWQMTRESIDNNIPCFGWELAVPEYYTVHGYDDVGYYFSGCGIDEGAGPKPWNELGMTEIEVVAMFNVRPAEKVDDARVVKDALSFAVEHAKSPNEWTFPKYASGPKAFRLWADALEGGKAIKFGEGYNAGVWTECRRNAIDFLKEAKERLPGKADALFDEAIEHYSMVYDNLKKLYDMHPFEMPSPETEAQTIASPEGAKLVRDAANYEELGLESLGALAEEL